MKLVVVIRDDLLPGLWMSVKKYMSRMATKIKPWFYFLTGDSIVFSRHSHDWVDLKL